MKINQHTMLYGILGHPIGHSLSPIMHNAAFKVTGLNAVYLAFETKDVKGFIQGIRAFGVKGMSVTIPYKSDVVPFLDGLDPISEKIGAVNTIVNNHGQLFGYNTDAIGALKSLKEVDAIPTKRCLIIGAGSAARAIGFVLGEQEVDILITNRTPERGKALARFLGCPFVPFQDIKDTPVSLLIQTTPIGMVPHVDQSPVPLECLRTGMKVMDIIYNPSETKLLRYASSRGCETISGLKMFLYQGAEQFRLWTGIEPPIDIMGSVVNEVLSKSSSSLNLMA